MTTITNRIFRTTAAAAVALLALFAATSPALAQSRFGDNGLHRGWEKNGKAADKTSRKATKRGAVVIVDPNAGTIDRSRTRTQSRNRSYTYNGRTYNHRHFDGDEYCNPRQDNRRSTYGYNNSGYGYNNGYGNYGYGNNGYNQAAYYNNGDGDLDRDEVIERGARSGYYAGFQRGQFDRSRRDNSNPTGHGAYQFGFDGFDPEWGWASTYQQTYRQYFVRGYQDAYGQRNYNTRYGGNNQYTDNRRY